MKTNHDNWINDKIRDEKPQYGFNRKAVKISILSSWKIGKYKYLADKKILPHGQWGW